MNNRISDKDKKDWENFTSGKEKLFNKDNKSTTKKTYTTKTIDLHGFTLEEANATIEKFIKKNYEDNLNKEG